MILRPFFSFFGSKWRAALHYSPPLYKNIIEPFAGSAGYSLRYPDYAVALYDSDPVIAGVWDYLVRASSREILRLPLSPRAAVDERLPQEARWLIGFWLDKGMPKPSMSPGSWFRSGRFPSQFWGAQIRARIGRQVEHIRHWRVYNQHWTAARAGRATYFVDPPYAVQGKHYVYSWVDYPALAAWAISQAGQVIVCEQSGADWLPFTPFRTLKANARSKQSVEVVYERRQP